MKLVDVYRDREVATLFLYDLIRERMTEPEVNISATMPTMQEHRKFVASHPYRCWYLIEHDGRYIGYVSATDRNEIGIVLAKAHRAAGHGPEAVRMLMEKHKPLVAIPSKRSGRWLANINPANERSIRMFSSLGFELIQHTYAL